MFAARGLAVASSVFFLVYVVLSLAVCYVWGGVSALGGKISARRRADLLFAFRIFPFAAAAAVTAALTVPSFLLLEPRKIREPLAALPLVLAVCGIGLAGFGAANAIAALLRAGGMISRWMNHAKTIESQLSIPVLRIEPTAPALTVAGIFRPRVLLSGAAQFSLNDNELRTALRHEVAHVRRRDNLKKLLLRFLAFPGMKSMETAWLESTEMAADDDAVSCAGDALDLAAALIKLSTLSPRPQCCEEEVMTAFVHSSAALMNARIERLIAWAQNPRADGCRDSQRRAATFFLAMTAAVIITAAFVVTYTQLLTQVHTVTEWLVR